MANRIVKLRNLGKEFVKGLQNKLDEAPLSGTVRLFLQKFAPIKERYFGRVPYALITSEQPLRFTVEVDIAPEPASEFLLVDAAVCLAVDFCEGLQGETKVILCAGKTDVAEDRRYYLLFAFFGVHAKIY